MNADTTEPWYQRWWAKGWWKWDARDFAFPYVKEPRELRPTEDEAFANVRRQAVEAGRIRFALKIARRAKYDG